MTSIMPAASSAVALYSQALCADHVGLSVTQICSAVPDNTVHHGSCMYGYKDGGSL